MHQMSMLAMAALLDGVVAIFAAGDRHVRRKTTLIPSGTALQGSQSAGCTLSPSAHTAMTCARSAWCACLVRTPFSSAAATTRSSWCTLCPATHRSDLYPAVCCAVQEQSMSCLHSRSEQLQASVGILCFWHRGPVSQTCVLRG